MSGEADRAPNTGGITGAYCREGVALDATNCSTMLHLIAAPTTSTAALAWTQNALANGRYYAHEPHFSKRCAQRSVTLRDVKLAVRRATSCEAYTPERGALYGGTTWRVIGPDAEGDLLSVGIECFEDHLGQKVLLMTVF